VKDRSAFRLLDAAAKSGRFDAAVKAYIAMVQRDPAAAAKNRPAMPAAGSTYLDTGIKLVNSALDNSKLADEQKSALLGFVIDLNTAKGDSKAADAASDELLKLTARNPNDPNSGRALAQVQLRKAKAALDQKQYDQVMQLIESSKAQINDPQQQDEALFMLAEAKYAIAQTKGDPDALKDAALAYMRVVANFKDLPGAPHVNECLMKTAAIYEKLKEPDEAIGIYQQLADQHQDAATAEQAKASIDRLKAAKAG
jgi:TolA-binding protein